MKWTREISGLQSGPYRIRKYEDRYNLRRLIVDRGYKLWHDTEGLVGKFDLLRDAKSAAESHRTQPHE